MSSEVNNYKNYFSRGTFLLNIGIPIPSKGLQGRGEGAGGGGGGGEGGYLQSTPRHQKDAVIREEWMEPIVPLLSCLGSCNVPGTCRVLLVGWLLACLTSQQQASVSQGRICSDNFTCCHTEIQAADPTFYLTQSQYTDTGPTSPSADPITPGAW